MSNLSQLLAQKAELEAEINRLRSAERAEAIGKVKELMQTHGLTVGDLGKPVRVASSEAPAKSGSKAPIKYRDPATGDSWSGRGLMPKWLKSKVEAGETKESFAV